MNQCLLLFCNYKLVFGIVYMSGCAQCVSLCWIWVRAWKSISRWWSFRTHPTHSCLQGCITPLTKFASPAFHENKQPICTGGLSGIWKDFATNIQGGLFETKVGADPGFCIAGDLLVFFFARVGLICLLTEKFKFSMNGGWNKLICQACCARTAY